MSTITMKDPLKHVILCPLNRKNLNGRQYSVECFAPFIGEEHRHRHTTIVKNTDSGNILFENILGYAYNVKIDSNLLIGDVHILKGRGEVLIDMLNTHVIRPYGTGTISKITGEITEYTLGGFSLTPKTEDPFMNILDMGI